MRKLFLLALILITITSSGYTQTVTIGDQVWTTKNLDVTTFRNGDPIPEAKTNAEWESAQKNNKPAWCYYDNSPANGNKYGKLYNWSAVNDPRGLAPAGYHIPTKEEWDNLRENLGSKEIGIQMKNETGWFENGNGTNKSGLSCLPGGFRGESGTFYKIGKVGAWWGRRPGENGSYVSFYIALNYNDRKDPGTAGSMALSVRCIKD